MVKPTKASRTVDAAIMKNVAKFLPADGFELTADLVGKVLTFNNLETPTFQGVKTFVGVYKDGDNKSYRLSAGTLKGARIMAKEKIVLAASQYEDLKGKIGIALRSEAANVWDNSVFLHTNEGTKMSDDSDFVCPDQLTVHSIVIKELEPGKPRVNPRIYKGFDKVVTAYRKQDSEKYPTWDDFLGELAKTDNRIEGLTETELIPVRGKNPRELRSMAFNMVFTDVES